MWVYVYAWGYFMNKELIDKICELTMLGESDAQEIIELCEPKWICVKDRLPKQEKNYLVFSRAYGFQVDMLCRNSPTLPYRWSIDKVTHWQYLPEPPKQ